MMLSDKRVLIALLVMFILSLVYAHYAMKPKQEVHIIQTSLDRINDNTLFEKQPIVIDDQIVNVTDLLGTLFKYQYLFKTDTLLEANDEVYLNPHKFMIVYNTSNENDAYVVLTPPKAIRDRYPSIDMILPPNNVLILPYLWSIEPSKEEEKTHSHPLQMILLNDLFHKFFHRNTN